MKQNHSASDELVSKIQKMLSGFVQESDYIEIVQSGEQDQLLHMLLLCSGGLCR